ncbi:septal ring lytic transglycosylase RlpA family protein [uncultured Chitinophaga sp.]|uniref:septal ring lytic transglycosylase RlpA family protein n=1 Tax=uncultured Chitinophaga sp. TaxID=339340 RepID=UPI00262AAC18|nr:septal ring lytic transglycosylase RlpA family protein [uncultured Chitinophaga sp.]
MDRQIVKCIRFLVICLCSSLLLHPIFLGAGKKNGDKGAHGTASFYADKFNGRTTANGEVFDNSGMTAAHNTLPLGSYVKVTNLRNGRSVIVKITDRLHRNNKRIIDLTKHAARQLGFVARGLTTVKVQRV